MNDIIAVITDVQTTDDEGFPLSEETLKELFCEVKSADYIDRQQSMNSKTLATIAFEVRREDFDDCRITYNKKHYYPSYVEWEGARYELIRWRYVGKDRAVMTCG